MLQIRMGLERKSKGLTKYPGIRTRNVGSKQPHPPSLPLFAVDEVGLVHLVGWINQHQHYAVVLREMTANFSSSPP